MRRAAATRAIVAARLARQSGSIALAFAVCAIFALMRPHAGEFEQTGAAILFVGLIGIAFALAQRGDGRLRELELCELSAPLYGRELARATAIVPCIEVTAALGAFWLAETFFGSINPWPIVLSLAAVNAAALVALCASVRHGFARTIYLGLAFAVIAAGLGIERYSRLGATTFLLIAGFIALRQYGEALARYDPV